jgi:hypothetical protein
MGGTMTGTAACGHVSSATAPVTSCPACQHNLVIANLVLLLRHLLVKCICRQGLSLIKPDSEHASIYMHVQGNLGALLLSADRPLEAITEFEGALKLGHQLEQQLQQQIKQHTKKQKAQKQRQRQVRRSSARGWFAAARGLLLGRLVTLPTQLCAAVQWQALLCCAASGKADSKLSRSR